MHSQDTSIAKQFLSTHAAAFYNDATADEAWRAALALGTRHGPCAVRFDDGSVLEADPMAGSITARSAQAA